MSLTIDYFIDSETDLARFEYYFEKELNIKSVTLKSIMFYNAYVDFKKGIAYYRIQLEEELDLEEKLDQWPEIIESWHYPIEDQKEFNLNDYCNYLNRVEKIAVKFHCDKNHLIIELLKDSPYLLTDNDPDSNYGLGYVTFRELFGFHTTYSLKGKRRSPKSIIDTPPILFLRSNLVDKQNTFYNNKYSDILCRFPADIDDDPHYKLQTYEPPNCTKNVYKRTNHLKFEITDENGKVINFRGKPVKIHLSFEVFPLINAL